MMRALIIPARVADELQDLRLMREMIAEALALPASASVREVTVAARVALIKLAVEEAVAEARADRLLASELKAGLQGKVA